MKFIVCLLVLLTVSGCNLESNPTEVETNIENQPDNSIQEIVEEEPTHVDGEILFTSERGGDRDLYLINADGTNCRVLLDLPSFEGHGDWAPDGNRIVFFSTMDGNRELYTINVMDEEITPTRLTNSKGEDHLPDWSPDGDRIVFESSRDGNSEIYIMNSDGSNQRRLTDISSDDKAPTFSPDGKWIGFTTKVGFRQQLGLIKVEDIDSSNEYPEVTILEGEPTGYIDWSPDGSKILYHGSYEINIMNSDGTNREQLTNSDVGTLWIPVWSPDSKWIACDLEAAKPADIYIMNSEGKDMRQLTFDPSSDWGPDWRPVKKKIVFDSNIEGKRNIYTVNIDGSNLTKLTDNDVNNVVPSWSPDGEKILYSSFVDRIEQLFTMDVDGSNKQQLTYGGTSKRAASWSHDGNYIAYASTKDYIRSIYLINSDGTDEKQITPGLANDFWPAWSLDDEYVIFTSFNETQDTYRVKIPDKKDFKIPTPELVASNCSRAEYSPDGSKLAFSTLYNGYWNIAIMDADGSNKRILTNNKHDEWVPTWTNGGKNLIFSREYTRKASIVLINIETLEEKNITMGEAQEWRPVMQPGN
ncbi:DUF5050 domain-containing protein [Mycoplasmatota bacterium zrk1]